MNSNKNHEIKISDFPPTNIYIFLEKDIRKNLIKRAKLSLGFENDTKLASWVNRKSSKYGLSLRYNKTDVSKWVIGSYRDSRTNITHPKYMPLWAVLELSKISNISIDDLSKNILSYRSGGNGNIISNPKLPLKITPEFESIIFHLFGDGYVGKSTPSYAQKNELAKKNFILKLKNCFGVFNENIYTRKCKTSVIRFPKAISDIIKHCYAITSFKSEETKIPLCIYSSPKIDRLACIIAYISDEGNIRDVISIASKNKIFLTDLKKLIESCGYRCKEVRQLKDQTYYLNLSNDNIKQLYSDYQELIREFPSCNLANKHYSLVCLATRKKKKIKDLEEVLLNLLKDKKLTIKQMSHKLGVSYANLRRHINKLYSKRKIVRIENYKGFVWALP